MNSPSSTSPSSACPADKTSSIGRAFQPFTDAYQADPYSFFVRARAEEPVFYSPDIDAYVVTRYDDCAAVLRDPDTFSASPIVEFVTPLCDAAMQKLIEARFASGPVLVDEDDPEHRPHRDIVRRAFNKQRMSEFEPKIRALVSGYVDEFVTSGEADLVMDYMWEIPALVAFHLIGVPDDEVDRVKTFAVRRSELTWGRPSDEAQIELAAGFADFWTWCTQHIDRLWDDPDDSFISEMIEMAKDPAYAGVLDRNYVYRSCMNLLFAGHETTTNGAGNAFMALLGDRDQWERLVGDPSLVRNAVDETLRYYSAAPLWRRRARQDTHVAGVAIPQDAHIIVAFGSANRDDAQFPDADRLDVSRENAKQHFTFGWGRHKCLGAGLARLEIALAIEEIIARVPHIRLVDGQEFSFARNIIFRGPQHVFVEWDPALNPRPADRPS